MSPLFEFTLAAHVILGVVGLIASFSLLLFLLKQQPGKRSLVLSALIAFSSYLLSWFSGGYYYVVYYGSNVKPDIKEGAYPWAHLVFMEAKEHLFLALPFATLVLLLAVYYGYDRLRNNHHYHSSLIFLSTTVVIIATIITLTGIIISGAAR